MSRTLIERMRDWRWWGEQVAHSLIGFLIVWGGSIVLTATGIPDPTAKIILVGISSAAGGVREVIQNHGDSGGSLGDAIVDLAAWSFGSIVGGLVA